MTCTITSKYWCFKVFLPRVKIWTNVSSWWRLCRQVCWWVGFISPILHNVRSLEKSLNSIFPWKVLEFSSTLNLVPWIVCFFFKIFGCPRQSMNHNSENLKVIYTKCSMFNSGNWTEWSAIWSEIIGVISKSNERAARIRFEITSMISDQNCTTRSSITTLLHPFWNRRI